MTLILTNLDFEMTWARANSDHNTLPDLILNLADRWKYILRLIAPQAAPLSLRSTLTNASPPKNLTNKTLIPWGWTPQVLDFANHRGLHVQAPPLDIIQLVNSKKFSHHLEKQLHLNIPNAAWIDHISALPAAINTIDGPWILKDPWGVSGRGQRRGEANSLPQAVQNWAQNIIAQHGGILLEPRLQIQQELSIHFHIHPDQTVQLIGTCELICGKQGTLRGLIPRDDSQAPPEILDGARQAARAVAQQGYFGPLGIDAMIGRWRGEIFLRPITEINARWTFGRMALALLKYAPKRPPQATLYWHFTASSKTLPELKPWPKTWTEGQFHLPQNVDPDGRSMTFVKLQAQRS